MMNVIVLVSDILKLLFFSTNFVNKILYTVTRDDITTILFKMQRKMFLC